MSPNKLVNVRRNRFKPGTVKKYYDIKEISLELNWAEEIFKRIKGIHIIDVTNRTVEEVANMIMESSSEKTMDAGGLIY